MNQLDISHMHMCTGVLPLLWVLCCSIGLAWQFPEGCGLQVTSREKGIPIDTLGFEVHVLGPKAKELSPPTEGVYVKVRHCISTWNPVAADYI